MSYKLYSDKPNKFNCNIEIDGASLQNSKARIVIESKEISYMFNGTIDEEGNCEINIPKTKNFLSEGNVGNMKLEVIADDVYFEPWSSDFSVQASKSVQVLVKEQVEEPKAKVKVNIAPQKKETKFISENNESKDEEFLTKEELAKLLKKRIYSK